MMQCAIQPEASVLDSAVADAPPAAIARYAEPLDLPKEDRVERAESF